MGHNQAQTGGVGYAAIVTRSPPPAAGGRAQSPQSFVDALAASGSSAGVSLLADQYAKIPTWGVRIKLVQFVIMAKGITDGFAEFPDIGEPPIDVVFVPNSEHDPTRPTNEHFDTHLRRWFEDNAQEQPLGFEEFEMDVAAYGFQYNPLPADDPGSIRGLASLTDDQQEREFGVLQNLEVGNSVIQAQLTGGADLLGGARSGSEVRVFDFRRGWDQTAVALTRALKWCVDYFPPTPYPYGLAEP